MKLLNEPVSPVFTDPAALPQAPDLSAPYRALTQLGTQAEDLGSQFYRAKQYSAIFAGRRIAQVELGKARDAALANPDPQAALDSYNQVAQDTKAKVQALGFDQFTKQRIDLWFDYTNELLSAHVQHNAQGKIVDQGLSDLAQGIDFNQKSAYQSGTDSVPHFKEMNDHLILDAVQAGFLGPQQAAQMRQRSAAQMDYTAAYAQVVNGDPFAALAQLGARKDGSNDAANYADLQPDQRTRLLNMASSRADAQTAQGQRDAATQDLVAAYRRVYTNDDRASALSMLQATDGKGGWKYWPNLDEMKRAELTHAAGAKIGMAGESMPAVLADVRAKGLQAGQEATPQDAQAWARQGFSPDQIGVLQKESHYATLAHSVLRTLATTPADQFAQIISQTPFFTVQDGDTLYRQHAQAALQAEAQTMLKLRQEDPAASADQYAPGAAGETTAQAMQRRLAYEKQVGVSTEAAPGALLTNAEAHDVVNSVGNVLLPDGQRLQKWLALKQSAGQEGQEALWQQLHSQMKLPQLAFALSPSNPTLNAHIFRALEARQQGALEKGIPVEQDRKQVLSDLATNVSNAAQSQHWDAQTTALWLEAGTDLALQMKSGKDAWQLLYKDQYDNRGIPKALPDAQRSQIADVQDSLMNQLNPEALSHGSMDAMMYTQNVRGSGRWALAGDDNTYQLLDGTGNLVLKGNGNPVEFRASDIAQFAKQDQGAAATNAKSGMLHWLTLRRPEWDVNMEAFDKYTDALAAMRHFGKPMPPASMLKPQVGKPPLVNPASRKPKPRG